MTKCIATVGDVFVSTKNYIWLKVSISVIFILMMTVF